MKLTSEQRKALIGRTFVAQASDSVDRSVTIVNVASAMNAGFHVHFRRHGSNQVLIGGLQKFLKRYPHELMEVKG